MKKLVVFNGGGLCSRLWSMACGLAIADHLDSKFEFVWSDTSHCTCDLDRLLAHVPFKIHESMDDVGIEPTLSGSVLREKYDFFDIVESKEDELFIRSSSSLLDARIYEDLHRIAQCEAVELLQLQPSLQNKINLFLRNRKNFIGVNIRRGDYISRMPWNMRSLGKYVTKINLFLRQHPAADIFLATDDGASDDCDNFSPQCENIHGKLEEMYPGKVFAFPHRSLDRSNPKAIEDALVEMMILRQSVAMIGTESSFFSKLAIMNRDIQSVML